MARKGSKGIFIVLIDTCAIAALSLYVQACEFVKKKPSEIADSGELKRCFRKKRTKPKPEWLCFETRGGINQGLKIYKNLKKKAEKGKLEIYFAEIAEIEILHLLLERKFDEELTRKGIPYRLRVKRFMRTQVDFGYEDVYRNWRAFKDSLSNENMELLLPERRWSNLMDDALGISNAIMKYIMLDTTDLLLYAIGIHIGADVICTTDSEFRDTITSIATGKDKSWQRIRKRLFRDLAKISSPFKFEYQKNKTIKLPVGWR